MKDVMKKEFISWYAGEVKRQRESGVEPNAVKVNLNISVVKPLCGVWFMKAFKSVEDDPGCVLAGFQKAGILDRIWPEKEM